MMSETMKLLTQFASSKDPKEALISALFIIAKFVTQFQLLTAGKITPQAADFIKSLSQF